MSLRKPVCIKCRTEEFGEEGWNNLADAWFDPYYDDDGTFKREGSTVCPYPVLERICHNIRDKVVVNADKVEIHLLEQGMIKVSYKGDGIWPVKSEPPLWCPFTKEHTKEIIDKAFLEEERIKLTEGEGIVDKGKGPIEKILKSMDSETELVTDDEGSLQQLFYNLSLGKEG